MSVIVMARLRKTSTEIEHSNRNNPELWRSVEETARGRGCLDHKLLAAANETMLVEEWDDTGTFEAFFDHTETYRKAIDDAGFRGFPDDIQLWRCVSDENSV
jgi:quinol monooxygenase YgiN